MIEPDTAGLFCLGEWMTHTARASTDEKTNSRDRQWSVEMLEDVFTEDLEIPAAHEETPKPTEEASIRIADPVRTAAAEIGDGRVQGIIPYIENSLVVEKAEAGNGWRFLVGKQGDEDIIYRSANGRLTMYISRPPPAGKTGTCLDSR